MTTEAKHELLLAILAIEDKKKDKGTLPFSFSQIVL